MIFLFFILSVWGLTHILVSSKILENLRNFLLVRAPFIGKMLDCYQCTGFWTGLFLYFIYSPPRLSNNLYFNFDFIFWAFVGSGICSFLSAVLSYIILKSKNENI
jgi:hypothetical protein